MISRRRLRGRALLAPLLLLATAGLHAQVVQRTAVGTGAVQAAGSGIVVAGTLGQAIIGPAATTGRHLRQGFWVPANAPRISAADPVAGENPASSLALQCTPNPISGSATIRAAFPENGTATLTLHDLLGREVVNLTHRSRGREEGNTTFELDAGTLENGWYTLLLVAGEERTTLPVHITR